MYGIKLKIIRLAKDLICLKNWILSLRKEFPVMGFPVQFLFQRNKVYGKISREESHRNCSPLMIDTNAHHWGTLLKMKWILNSGSQHPANYTMYFGWSSLDGRGLLWIVVPEVGYLHRGYERWLRIWPTLNIFLIQIVWIIQLNV